VLGVGGVAALVIDPGGSDPTRADPLGALAVVAASLSWALGSLWSVRADLPAARSVGVGAQMLAAG
jgi:drug/metabolite transporter (DMT)-like permease